jgi:cysteine-rich repeat protein
MFCASAAAAGGGTLEQASGGLLTTAYAQPVASQNTPKPISDNNPIGTVDEIDLPDIGPAKSLTVSVKLNNSDLSHLQVYLYDPNKVLYVLHKGKPGKLLDATYPTPDKPFSGDLSTWIGKNPKGKWRVRIIDTKFLNNKDDGELTSWQINVQAAKSKQITVKGAFVAAGGFYAPTSAGPPFPCKAGAAGQLYFDLLDKHLYYCDGDWRKLLPEAICGNGVINPGEQCDDSNTNNGDGCTALCLKNVCGDGILHKGVEACEDGNKVPGDGCSAACKLESKTFKGYANWSQNVNNQTDAQQDTMMDQVCKKYGPTVVAATIDEIINHPKKIKNMPSKNGSGQHLLGKCPNCAGNKSGGKSGHCRKCINPNSVWPKALNSGWNTNCCSSTRSALCLL